MSTEQSLPTPVPSPKWSFFDGVFLAVGWILAVLLWVTLIATKTPLGLVGQWVWNRSPAPPVEPVLWLIPFVVSVAYLCLVAVDALLPRRILFSEPLMLSIILAAGLLWQWVALDLPKPPLGMERYAPALYFESTTGYFTQARQIENAGDFLRQYKDWVSKADSFHQGTHPPGLILLFRGFLTLMDQKPDWAQQIERIAPTRMRDGLQAIGQPLNQSERSTLLLASMLAWGLSWATALLVYGLIRLEGSTRAASLGAILWMVMPASLLFLPLADAFYPFFAMLVWLLTVTSIRARVGLLAVFAGGACCLGLLLSLAFVVVGGIALIYVVLDTAISRQLGRGIITLACLAAGIALPIEWIYENYQLSMIDVWQINLQKHAGFYVAMPRSYLPWLGINLLEFAAMVSPPLFIGAAARGTGSLLKRGPASVDRLIAVWFLTLIALDLSGRNRSESARLWLFLMPVVPVAVARLWGESAGVGSVLGRVLLTLAAMLGTLLLLGWVEPLLPIVLTP